MRRQFIFAPVFVASLALAGCGGAAAPASSAPPSAPPASVAAPSAAVGTAASAPAKLAASGQAAAAPNFVEGTVKTLAPDKVTLADGETFAIGAGTLYSTLQPIAASDLKAGQFAAITAKLQPDGALLASEIRVSPPGGGPTKAGQFPLSGGNLMTNAPIKQAGASGLTVTLPGGDAAVKYGPGVKILLSGKGAAAQVKSGTNVVVVARDKDALAIQVIEPAASPRTGY